LKDRKNEHCRRLHADPTTRASAWIMRTSAIRFGDIHEPLSGLLDLLELRRRQAMVGQQKPEADHPIGRKRSAVERSQFAKLRLGVVQPRLKPSIPCRMRRLAIWFSTLSPRVDQRFRAATSLAQIFLFFARNRCQTCSAHQVADLGV
jgi:hypothetical protein